MPFQGSIQNFTYQTRLYRFILRAVYKITINGNWVLHNTVHGLANASPLLHRASVQDSDRFVNSSPHHTTQYWSTEHQESVNFFPIGNRMTSAGRFYRTQSADDESINCARILSLAKLLNVFTIFRIRRRRALPDSRGLYTADPVI